MSVKHTESPWSILMSIIICILIALIIVIDLYGAKAQAEGWTYNNWNNRQGFQWGGVQQRQTQQGQSFNYYNYSPNQGITFGMGNINRNGSYNNIQIGPQGPQFGFGNIQRVPNYENQ